MSTQPTVTYAIEAFEYIGVCIVHVERLIVFPERWTAKALVTSVSKDRATAVARAVAMVRELRHTGRLRDA